MKSTPKYIYGRAIMKSTLKLVSVTAAILCAAGAFALSLCATASASPIQVSNLGQPTDYSQTHTNSLSPVSYYMVAGKFTTDGQSYTLTGARAFLRNDPGFGVATYEARLYSDAGATPGSLLGIFDSNPVLADGAGAATVSFTITGISLDENTSYWLAIRNTTGREFGWTTTYRDGQSSPGAWTIDDSADATSQSTGATWSDFSSSAGGRVPRFAIEAASVDQDGDGIADDTDNCPAIANADQADADGDGFGDVCDACPLDPNNDADGDGICGDVDNCPAVANSDQLDTDGDAIGDACDPDDDNDGVADGADNCRLIANSDQADLDMDGAGDACDLDADGDGITDASDVCLGTVPSDVIDADGCSIAQHCPTENSWKNHGAYVKCVAQTADDFAAAALISATQRDDFVTAAGDSDVGNNH